MGAYRIYLDENFEPTTRAKATIIKAVSDDGRVTFYHPKQTTRTMKAVIDTARADAWLAIGAELGVDFETIARDAWIEGCEHEMEHAATVDGDKITIAKIALDHLHEDAEYYRKLRKIESAGNTQKAIITNAWGDVRELTDAEIEALAQVTASDIDAIPEVLPFLNADG